MQKHEERFQSLMSRANVHPQDKERESLFWILSGNSEIYERISDIYDFTENTIKPDYLENGHDLSSSSERLIRLGFNLYNGFPADVLDSFQYLDEDNFNLGIQALKKRFQNK